MGNKNYMTLITEEEYSKDPGSIFERTKIGNEQIGITGTDGEILMILGTGPIYWLEDDMKVISEEEYFKNTDKWTKEVIEENLPIGVANKEGRIFLVIGHGPISTHEETEEEKEYFRELFKEAEKNDNKPLDMSWLR